jgi:peptide/nickel transport system permease protein
MPEPSPESSTTATVVPAGVAPMVLEPTEGPGASVVVEKSATKRMGIVGWIAIGWLVATVLSALLAPWLPIPAPDKKFILLRGDGPSLAHPFGLDGIGQDMFSRVIWGARASLTISVASVAFGLIFGGVLGLVSGYYRGKADTVLSYVFNTFLAIPQLVLALAIIAVFASDPTVSVGKREFWLIMSIGLVSIPILGRITRASTLAWSQREFVLAARSMGAKNKRIIVRDVLPNVLPAMFSIALLGIAVAMVAEGGLSILGVGVHLPGVSWGSLIAGGRNSLQSQPALVFEPLVCLFLTVLSLNYLGDVVRARFDVRESVL